MHWLVCVSGCWPTWFFWRAASYGLIPSLDRLALHVVDPRIKLDVGIIGCVPARCLPVHWYHYHCTHVSKPDFYPATALPEAYRYFLYYNPLTPVIEQTRDILFWGKSPDFSMLGVYWLISVTVACMGFAWFQKTRKGFADVLWNFNQGRKP